MFFQMGNSMAFERILIVDDEELARSRIRRFLKELNCAAEIQEASHGLMAIEVLKSFPAELVFLDVQMPGLTGFEVLQQIETKKFQIIFQTAFDQFAVQAFEENACDYLLKPYSKERFEKAYKKAVQNHRFEISMHDLEVTLIKQKQFLRQLSIRHNGKIKVIPVENIECLISRDHYTCVYSSEGEWISELSLGWLEQHLNPQEFVRCHRNNIVAIKQLQCLGSSLESQVKLVNGMSLPFSRHRRKAIMEQLSVTPRVPS
jgi:two-component system LytT family response regulator